MNILDFLSGKTDLKQTFQDQLDGVQRQVEAKIGEFLSSGQKIADLRTRAQAQQNSDKSDVVSQAKSLTARSNALLTQFNSIQGDSTSVLTKIAALKADVDKNSAFFDPGLQSATRVVQFMSDERSKITDATTSSVNVAARIKDHLDQVHTLDSDVNNLESYASGKGLKSLISSATGDIEDKFLAPALKIVVIGGLAWLLLPSLLGRTAKKVL